MELKQWHGFCLCPLGGACPPDAAPADAPFSPLVFLVRRDPLRSRGLFAVTVLDEVFEAETAVCCCRRRRGRRLPSRCANLWRLTVPAC